MHSRMFYQIHSSRASEQVVQSQLPVFSALRGTVSTMMKRFFGR